MFKVMVTGAGKIGSLIACMLTETGDYEVYLADINFQGADVRRLLETVPSIKTLVVNVEDIQSLEKCIRDNQITAVISSLPYFLNTYVAEASRNAHAHYFDLTEDTAVTEKVKALAKNAKTALVPQCGLAPGIISIAANGLIKEFETCHHVKLRVGALPQRASNGLHYSLTWSTDGVINEYGNPCYGIANSQPIAMAPLEGLESIIIDGCEYEAFNTSGGLGSLGELYHGQVKSMNYKTIRYPGHCEKMRFLMNDLGLNEDRATLKHIFERSIPKTYQDMVIIYVSVEGIKHGEYCEKSYSQKIYPATIANLNWSAIQISTASGVCAIADLILNQEIPPQGLVLQESFCFDRVLANRFGQYYA